VFRTARGFYTWYGRTLVVGDGDFAFSASLADWIEQQTENERFVTSVLQGSEPEVVADYHPHNSMVKEHLRWMKKSDKIQYYFGVDATKLNSTTTSMQSENESLKSVLMDRVVFCYAFPTSNGHVMERHALVENFFQSVKNWKKFDKTNGQVILGLKSSKENEDYQLEHWKVESMARSIGFRMAATSQAMVTFWRATHVNGRPLNKVKHIFDDRDVKIKFYAFALEGSGE
jgi:Domain of unknown function (DUF2431)